VDSVIANTSEPPYAFIEIALSQGVPELYSAGSNGGFRASEDQSKVGRWLLGNLQQAELQSTAGLAAAIQKAMLVCRHCGLDDQTYYEFDGIDDSLYLARHGQYGTVDECRAEFFACLQRHALPFPGASQAQPIIPPDLSRQAALGR